MCIIYYCVLSRLRIHQFISKWLIDILYYENKLFLSFVAASFASVGRYYSEKNIRQLAHCWGLYTSVLSCLSAATADKILCFELWLAYLRFLDWSITIGPMAKRRYIFVSCRGWAPTNLKVWMRHCFRVVHKDYRADYLIKKLTAKIKDNFKAWVLEIWWQQKETFALTHGCRSSPFTGCQTPFLTYIEL